MSGTFRFCDLCVETNSTNDRKVLRATLETLCERGYSTVAINHNFDESALETEKKGKKKSSANSAVAFPEPSDFDDIVAEFSGRLRVLSRLTFAFSDPTKLHTLNQNPNVRKFDLYAVIPKSQPALQFACSQLNADIVSVNTKYTGLKFSRKLYQQATERGIHFEIRYVDIIDRDKRKLAIHYSHLFHMFGKSKNIIVTSGATEPSQIRNPYDVVNLAAILGLNETKAKASILSQCRYLILKAEGRRYGKAVFEIQLIANDESPMEIELNDNTSIAKPDH